MAHSTLFATQAVSKTLRSGASAAWIPRSPRPNTEIQTCCHSLRSSISKHCLQIRNPFWFLRAHTLDPHDAIRDRCFFMLLVRCLAWSSTFLLLVLFLLCRSFTSLVDAHIHTHTHTRALSVASMTLLPPPSEAGVQFPSPDAVSPAWLPRLTCGRRSNSTPVAGSLLTNRSSLKKTHHEVGVLSRRSTKTPVQTLSRS
jgi:hypothetical protein